MNDLAHIDTAKFQPAPMQAIDPMIRMIEAVVQNPDLPIERLEKMLEMKNQQEDRQREDAERAAKRSYFTAMAECQSQMPVVAKNKNNTHTKSQYADIGAVLDAATPVYTRHGFSVNFHPRGVENEHLIMVWTISHGDGHQETGEARYPIDNKGPNGSVNKTGVQGLASTETYARRYLMLSLFNIATSDDTDGNATTAQPITAEQYLELRDLIEQAGITEEIVCNAEKIQMLPELSATRFDGLATKLRATIAKNAASAKEKADA